LLNLVEELPTVDSEQWGRPGAVPVFVFKGLGGRRRGARDRHHRFWGFTKPLPHDYQSRKDAQFAAKNYPQDFDLTPTA
jgi:hypothetical protein